MAARLIQLSAEKAEIESELVETQKRLGIIEARRLKRRRRKNDLLAIYEPNDLLEAML